MEVVALFGPTAIGKTEVAIELADVLRSRGEDPVAVSVDALQVYTGLDILTGKPSAEQLRRLEHRLISFVPLEKPFNAYLFAERAHAEIDKLLGEGRRPIVVGGTGLYLRAALADLDMKPVDSEEESQLWSNETRRPTLLFGLFMDRGELNKRIERRVGRIVQSGARGEVEAALRAGISRTARKAIGFDHLTGGLTDGEAISEIGKDSRSYAKRQVTWMRKTPNVNIIDRTGLSDNEVARMVVACVDSGHEV